MAESSFRALILRPGFLCIGQLAPVRHSMSRKLQKRELVRGFRQ